ncbi:subtilisin family serine protease [Marmoricola sp. OAE513]|uniref:S8 family serine peptidase n=1 Tax=Marmoricola sp. OAE513 TaxID=2817894 RepID=UPI001AEA46F8
MPSQPRRSARGPVAVLGSLAIATTMLGPVVPGAQAEAAAPVAPAPVVDPAAGADLPVPARIVVRWKDSASTAARERARAATRTRAGGALGDEEFELVHPRSGQSVSDALRALRADPRVASADADHYLATFGTPDDPDLPRQWALQPDGATTSAGGSTSGGGIDVGPAWERAVGSPQTVVAVIDQGYNFEAPDLAPVAWQNADEVAGNGVDDDGNGFVDDVRGWDFVGSNLDQPTGDNDPTDDDPTTGGHGAHVAGILGARGNDGTGITGVAQNVRIMPLRACSRSALGGTNRCLLSAIVQAINYAGKNGARVANLSLGGYQYDQVMADALAANPATLYVAAAGNDARDNEQRAVYPCNYDPVADSTVPGRVDNVVCVAALDRAGKPASFSNWGARHVDLAAPGVDIWSIYRRYEATVVWSDDFEDGDLDSWVNGDPGFGVGAAGDGPLVSKGLTDSPGAAPVAGAHAIRTRSFAVPRTAEYCEIGGERFAKLTDAEDFSYSLWVDGAETPVSRSLAVTWTNPVLKSFSTGVFEATELAGKQVSLHLDYTAPPGLDAGYGVWLDNLKVSCGAVARPAPYQLLSGTSMAAPMVSGAAALLYSLKPGATTAQVRAAILGSARRVAAWKGRTVTGGRLDVAAAMGRLVPPDTRMVASPRVSGQAVAIKAGQNGTIPGVTFQCRIDSGPFRACNPNGAVRGVRPGHHVFAVRAVDRYGNVDPTPARASFVVAGCIVPAVIGRTPSRAVAAFDRAGCKVGKLVRPTGVPNRKLKVKAVYPVAGAYRLPGELLTVVLKRR